MAIQLAQSKAIKADGAQDYIYPKYQIESISSNFHQPLNNVENNIIKAIPCFYLFGNTLNEVLRLFFQWMTKGWVLRYLIKGTVIIYDGGGGKQHFPRKSFAGPLSPQTKKKADRL